MKVVSRDSPGPGQSGIRYGIHLSRQKYCELILFNVLCFEFDIDINIQVSSISNSISISKYFPDDFYFNIEINI